MDASLTSHFLKSLVSKGSAFAPTLAANLAMQRFNRPRPSTGLSDHEYSLSKMAARKLGTATKFRVSCGRTQVQAYHFSADNGKGTIILVHGWSSQAGHLMAMVQPILDHGFSVVSFDLPAHGLSSGNTTNIGECARALQSVASLFPQIHGIVAHSFGGPVTALALAGISSDKPLFEVGKIALIASPNESAYIMNIFGGAIGLEPQAQRYFEAAFETVCECPLEFFTGSKYFSRVNRPMLVLHGENDREIPHAHGVRYGELDQCEFISLKNVGHRDILYAPEVSERIGRFMAKEH